MVDYEKSGGKVAKNRDMDGNVFDSEPEAITWLLDDATLIRIFPAVVFLTWRFAFGELASLLAQRNFDVVIVSFRAKLQHKLDVSQVVLYAARRRLTTRCV